MTPFEQLRLQVRQQPDAVAVSTPYRVATFRKMWSRIERSTARLQAEWGIGPGDTIAYFGCGHLDALVMYFATARCGARSLPLEHPQLQAQIIALSRDFGVRLVLHDDALAAPAVPAGVDCRALSTLIATPCRFAEAALEDCDAPSLIEFDLSARASGEAAGSGPEQAPSPRLRSLATLAQLADAPGSSDTLGKPNPPGMPAAAGSTSPSDRYQVRGALFDPDVFGPVALASLLNGSVLTLLAS